ncbi:MAG: cyclase family protein [Proteobacteria bacterium]|nr:cyclase family protein [Pseudomonadota bacterium]
MASEPGRANNWGRWGAEDERGAANLITPERLCAAAGLVRRGRVYSLALPLQSRDVPVLPRRSPPLHFMTLDGGDYTAGLTRKSGFKSSDDYLALNTHGTTHIDALAHAWYGSEIYNGFSETTIRSGGARRCGIDKLGSLAGRGVLLDLCRHKGVEPLEKGYAITPDDLTACAAAQGVALGEGDVLVVRTGWLKVFADQGPGPFFAGEPGIGAAAARWIADAGIVAVAADNFGVEAIPTEDGETAPVHRMLIRDFGVYLMELLVLDGLARDQVYEFLFVAAPLRITGGVGSPLNPLAIA